MMDSVDAWIHDKFDKLDERIDELREENLRLKGRVEALEDADEKLRSRVETLEQVVLVLGARVPDDVVEPSIRADMLMELNKKNGSDYWPKVFVRWSANDRKWMFGLDYSR